MSVTMPTLWDILIACHFAEFSPWWESRLSARPAALGATE